MSEIVFGTLIVILNYRWTNLRRRNDHHRANHPVWTEEVTIKSHKVNIFIRDTTEQTMNGLYFQRLLLLQKMIMSNNACNTLTCKLIGLRSATTIFTLLTTPLDIGREGNYLLIAGLSLSIE